MYTSEHKISSFGLVVLLKVALTGSEFFFTVFRRNEPAAFFKAILVLKYLICFFSPLLLVRVPFPGTDETSYGHGLEDIERTESRVLENIRETTTEPVYTTPEMRYDYEENEYFTEEDAEGKKPQEYGEAEEENEENLEATVETRAAYSDYGMILEYENLS